ncbi:diaminopimelate decarboxylase [Virgibacillus sp. LDC-1]|uniref:diaminopimelate decarboxylase n=1 Tax=Virgibacillus sp. LDC-1 TaxID=3039856 RepID=UPI0024DE4CAE|nr:diaminopimelate decarboxylase [Virgibacillus sp. LDC-1]
MSIKNFPFEINKENHLMIGGLDTIELIKEFGSPLFVYDVGLIRKHCRSFVNTFKKHGVKAEVAYASKAFSSIAILQVMKQEGLSIDVVSEGELYTALQADFPVEKIHFHGNNKSERELIMAIENNIGCVIVDNFHEIDLLERLLKEYNKEMNVLLRVTPGIESDTHQYIMTGNEDSKFGFNVGNGQAEQAFQKVQELNHIKLQGIHCHIGSQIFETERFTFAASVLFKELKSWHKKYGYAPNVLNLGGGFGIRYTEADQPTSLPVYVEAIIDTVRKQAEQLQLPMPEIWIEPGRSIVGDAGITLYTIGATKDIPGVRKYISVDGGMTDNLRPSLYQAKYEAVLANRVVDENTETVSVAGKCCESGDMLIWDLSLPKVDSGDILAVFSTGAYGYSMANHYNRFAKPAVVFVEEGKSALVIRRESYEDVVQNDLPYI